MRRYPYPLRLRDRGRGWRPLRQAHRARPSRGAVVRLGLQLGIEAAALVIVLWILAVAILTLGAP